MWRMLPEWIIGNPDIGRVASEVFRPQTDQHLATGTVTGVKSKHKHCGSTAEFNLDIAIGVQPANGRTSRFERSGSSDRKHFLTGLLQALDAADPQSSDLARA
jgi:hypothetical protein